MPNPCDSKFLKLVLEGCKRWVSSSISHRNRLPILPDHLQKLVSQFASSGASCCDIRDVSLCLVAFSAFLRYDEISNIKWCDVDIKDQYFSL